MDNFAIPENAKHVDTAHKFIKYYRVLRTVKSSAKRLVMLRLTLLHVRRCHAPHYLNHHSQYYYNHHLPHYLNISRLLVMDEVV